MIVLTDPAGFAPGDFVDIDVGALGTIKVVASVNYGTGVMTVRVTRWPRFWRFVYRAVAWLRRLFL